MLFFVWKMKMEKSLARSQWMKIRRSKTLQPSAELSRLGVRTDMQNQGIARQLLQHGMEELKKQGKRSVHFLVCKTNKKALRSYEKLHFDVVGESGLFDEDWWCYEKEL